MLPRDIDNRADVMLIADERLRTLLAFYRPVGGPGYALGQLCVCLCVPTITVERSDFFLTQLIGTAVYLDSV